MKRKSLLIVIICLAIGFAAVTTSVFINGSARIAILDNDFDVYFSSAILNDKDESNKIIVAKGTKISFSAQELSSLDDKVELKYQVTNNSKNYGARVSVMCEPVGYNDYLDFSYTFDSEIIPPKTTGSGIIRASLKKIIIEEADVEVDCKLVVNQAESEVLGTNNVPSNNAPDTVSFSTTLKDKDGNPIKNAAVIIKGTETIVTTTDEYGNIYVNNLDGKEYEIIIIPQDKLEDAVNKLTPDEINDVSSVKGTINESDTSVKLDNNNKVQDIENSNNTLSGTLVDNSNNPSSNVIVVVMDSEGKQHIVTTDDSGHFIVPNVPEGSYEVSIIKPEDIGNVVDKLDESDVNELSNDKGVIKPSVDSDKLTSGNTIENVNNKNETVSATLKDNEGNPSSNQTIVIVDEVGNKHVTTTDDNGNFKVPNLEGNKHEIIIVDKNKVEDAVNNLTNSELDEVSDSKGTIDSNTTDVTLTDNNKLQNIENSNNSLSGTLTNDDNQPIKDSVVVIVDSSGNKHTATTDESGHFVIPDVPKGSYDVIVVTPDDVGSVVDKLNKDEIKDVASGVGSIDTNKDTQIIVGDNKVDSIEPNRDVVNGTLKDKDGNPIPDKTIVIVDEAGNKHVTTTDKDGNFSVDGVDGSKYEIYEVPGSAEDLKDKPIEDIKNEATGSGNINTEIDITLPGGITADKPTIGEPKKEIIKVTFKDGEDVVQEKDIIQYNKYGTLPSVVKTGYTFLGWYVSDELITESSLVTSSVSVTVLAKWEANSYVVSFNEGGHDSKNVTYNNAYGEMPTPSKTGYTFAGWYLESEFNNRVENETIVKTPGDHTLYAKWQAKEYVVTLNPDGGSVDPTSINVLYNSTYKNLPVPEKSGYTFNGWYLGEEEITNDSVLTEANNIALIARYTPKRYNVTFDAAGGEASMLTKQVVYDSKYGNLAIADKEGYVFAGWYLNENLVTSESIVKITSDVTLVARYTNGEYQVSFDTAGGTNLANMTISYNEAYGSLPTPIKTGYTFAGWYLESEFNNRVENATIVTTPNDHTLYAKWKANEYVVTLNPDGGSADPTSINVLYNSTYKNLPVPEKSGYTFSGWYLGTVEITNTTSVEITSNVTLLAKYVANKYVVNFDANSGNVSTASKEVTYANSYGELPTSTKTGYTFTGWYTDKTGGSKVDNTTSVSIAGEHTLYAHWQANSYTITFNSNGGSAVANKVVTYNGVYGELDTPTKAGYTFLGWYLNDNQITATSEVLITSNSTLEARWSANTDTTYTVKHWQQKIGSDANTHNSANYDLILTETPKGTTDSSVSPDTKTYTGFTSPAKQSTTVKGDNSAEVNYYYTRNQYTLTINKSTGVSSVSNAGSYYYNQDVTVGYTIASGYTFTSITGDKTSASFKMPAGNVTVSVNATANKYTITYNANSGSGTMANDTATYDQNFTSKANAYTKTGYTFNGWNEAANGSGEAWTAGSAKKWTKTNNITLYAQWRANTYSVSFDANGGTAASNITVTYNGTYGNLPTPTRTGYTFAGWYTAASGGTQVTSTTKVTITANQTLYAHWTASTYTITYALNSGTAGTNKPTSGTYDSVLTISKPTRAGYDFAGWTVTTGLNTSTAKYGTSSTTVTSAISSTTTKVTAEYFKNLTATNGGSVTLTANWTAKTFNISFNANGGTSSSAITVTYNGTYGNLPTPTRTGYTFAGWYTASSGGTQVTSTTKVTITANQTLYARWTGYPYTITYALNGGTKGSSAPTSATFGSVLTISNPTKVGYKFAGWTVTSGLNTSTAKYGTSSTSVNSAISSSTLKVTAQYFKNLTATKSGNVTLTANWDFILSDYIKSISKGDIKNVDLNLLANANTSGVYKVDDNGTKYFYRGNVTNNNIIYGNKCWKIIYLENGELKIIYNGVPSSGKCSATGASAAIGNSVWNSSSNDNAYVGYMYGNTNSGSHDNYNDSAMKKYLDNWYEQNLNNITVNTPSNISFCNDRSLTEEEIRTDSSGMSYPYYNHMAPGIPGDGSGNQEAHYGVLGRSSYYTMEVAPSLSCGFGDLLSVKDEFWQDCDTGGYCLKYPIGLITLDEAIYAGYTSAYKFNNGQIGISKAATEYQTTTNYLYTGAEYWTMTPTRFYNNVAMVGTINKNIADKSVSSSIGVRPVIMVYVDNKVFLGDGTAANPYKFQ